MILEIKNLKKSYKDFKAVDSLNLKIEEGEIYGLLGPNGAGKSTTINAITGLTKINGGEIKIFGKTFNGTDTKIKRNIGVVPQDIAVFSELSAYENVAFFGKLNGLRGTVLKDRIKEALDFTGLWDRKKDKPGQYSGGMQRRLNIACAVVHRPKLIIMDEPTVGIDPQSRNHILDSVRKLNEMGSTIIYTSHYMEEVETLCSKITIMDHGKEIATGTKEQLKEMIANEEKVELEVSELTKDLIEAIENIPNVKRCNRNENMLEVISEKNSENISNITAKIAEFKSKIISINVEKPSLEGVFLTLTGRKLRD
ncbi:ABC transporter ATP-binding protein [Clostridium felsineum]|uniref:Linearmycin resistance ATP-binding protein LnrL n=1 Tax=Clostridium felsineum TaxID=36839 RepID=A0A1S8LC82_9CLOT|nr:ABC transporter ATP-binding protein [Clostridium felsineum]URZ04788.1 Linearmycin resistance ATP-binding protein LnrL [Clostridium felsineum]URZ09829.1 Linearmycin resistance ATP-binding protein LnrL [Clostridium felsineum]